MAFAGLHDAWTKLAPTRRVGRAVSRFGPMSKALSAHRDRCVVARQYEPLAPATCEHLGSVLCHMPGLSGASRGAFAAGA